MIGLIDIQQKQEERLRLIGMSKTTVRIGEHDQRI
jgi:hypothetical protein